MRNLILILGDQLDRDSSAFDGFDATEDAVLEEAGIGRATGIVFSLGNDRDNLFATISARRLNEGAAIVTRGSDPRSEKKFRSCFDIPSTVYLLPRAICWPIA